MQIDLNLLTNDLYENALVRPAVERGFDEICILAGYASPAMLYRHLGGGPLATEGEFSKLPSDTKVNLVYGMYPSDGIAQGYHEEFQKLCSENSRVLVRYRTSAPPIHSKVYIWLKEGNPKLAFSGSANYSQGALTGRTLEVLSEIHPQQAHDYFQPIWASATFPTLLKTSRIARNNNKYPITATMPTITEKVELPLTFVEWVFRRTNQQDLTGHFVRLGRGRILTKPTSTFQPK